MEIKQEPTSEGEQEIEAIPDLPLECLLCSKSFNSVTGLKVSFTLFVYLYPVPINSKRFVLLTDGYF